MFGKTATRRVHVTRPAGLHARPSSAVATASRRFRAKITIASGNLQADAASILELLSLGAGQGTELLLSAKGPDAQEAVDALAALFASGFEMDEDSPSQAAETAR